VVHLGDDFFSGRFPFVDLESGGSVEGLTKNIGELITKIPAGAKLIPGHGPISTVDDLKAYHRMIVETTAIVRQKIESKKTLAQIKSEGLPAEWNSWGTGFIKTDAWLELVYLSLTKK
jgi:glyoxylase-like metal-dependent hydrolase (beta-lactamase superfamily II)